MGNRHAQPGHPRVCNRILKRVRDFAQVKSQGVISRDVADMALSALEIDALGLDATDRRMLESIILNFGGGRSGWTPWRRPIGEESVTLEDVYEPYLMQIGFLNRTPRGRCATKRLRPLEHPLFGADGTDVKIWGTVRWENTLEPTAPAGSPMSN